MGLRARGQTTIEYILMLVVATMLVLLLAKNFIWPVLNQLGSVVGEQVKSMLGSNLHQIRIGR